MALSFIIANPLRKLGRARGRRISGIALLAIGLALALCWVGSRFWWFVYVHGSSHLGVRNGLVIVALDTSEFGSWLSVPGEWMLEPIVDPTTRWTWLAATPAEVGYFNLAVVYAFGHRTPSATTVPVVKITGYALALPWLVGGGLLMLSAPRWPPKMCQSCGYDRAGLAETAKCPECGTIAAAASCSVTEPGDGSSGR